MATALRVPRTLGEFLDWESRQPERWEFVDGQLRMMAGGTIDHAQIAANIIAALRPRLRGSGCRAFGSDLKLLVRATGRSFYPDVMVRCGRATGSEEAVDDPLVLFEVLPMSTAEYDLTKKRKAYQTLSALRMIVYVSQDRSHVHVHVVVRDQDGRWEDDDIEGLDATLALGPLDVGLTLAESTRTRPPRTRQGRPRRPERLLSRPSLRPLTPTRPRSLAWVGAPAGPPRRP